MAGTALAQAGQLISNLSQALSFGEPTAVGLSIGSSAIKIAELQRQGKHWKLLHFGIFQLPEDAIVNREIVNAVAVMDSIKTLTSQIRLKNNRVCSALSGTSLIIKRMTLDVPNPRELQEQVFWEAEQYLPFDVSEVVMDFHVLSRGKDSKTDVLFVAIKRAVLDMYMGCIEDAGLKPRFMDTDFFALQNVFEANYPANPERAAALVDLGASGMKLVVVHGGVPVFTKDSTIGGRSLTAEIQKNLGLSYADAEALKAGGQGGQGGQGGTMPQEVSELMQVMADNLGLEIKKAIDFYNASSFGPPIEFVLLAGGAAKIPNLSTIVEEGAQLPAQLINPFNSIVCDPSIFTQEYLAAIAPLRGDPDRAGAQGGSEMIIVNLAKRSKAAAPSSGGGTSALSANADSLRQALDVLKALPIQKYAAALVLGVAATYFVNNYQDTQIQALQQVLDKLNAEKPQLQAQTSRMQGLEQVKKSMESDELMIRTKLDTIQKLISGRGAASGVLAELSKITPPGVWFTGFGLKGNDITMQGFSVDFSQISDFMKELNESSIFTNPALKDTQTAEDDQKREMASFDILARKR